MYTNITEIMERGFNHKNIHKYTWEQHTKNFKTILDYIITKQNLKQKMQDVRDYRGPNCGTDQKLLIAKFFFPLYVQNKDKYEQNNENNVIMADRKKKYNIESLHNENTKLLY
jgi:hypothetical protein